MSEIKIIAEMMGYEAIMDGDDVFIRVNGSVYAFDPSNDSGLRDRCLETLHINTFYLNPECGGWRASIRGEPITLGGPTAIIVCDAQDRTLAIMKALFELAERRAEFIHL